jgi:cell division protein FtsW
MARKLKSDRILFLTTILLVAVSIVMVYSASAVMADERYSQPYFFLIKQLMWAVLGVALLGVVMRIDYRHYREPVFIWTCLGVVCLALGIQPSEVAKLSAIVFIAALLERRMHRINDVTYALGPISLVVALLVGLILIEPDFGTAMSLAVVAAVMVFAAGVSYVYVLGAVLTMMPLIAMLVIAFPYRRQRLMAFLNPWDDPLGSGFQIIQSLIAVGTGGITGRGLMNGVQKLFYLPEAHNDFIYAVIAEELGFIGASCLLICFCVLTWRGLRIALQAQDSFGAFLAIGVTAMIAIQAFINMSVVLGLLPTKGIPLPFISQGGSSMLVNLMGMGVLLNVSQHAATEA